MILAQLTDLIKAYEMIITAKSSGLDFWEGLILILFILKVSIIATKIRMMARH